jgi:hypothetical protein
MPDTNPYSAPANPYSAPANIVQPETPLQQAKRSLGVPAAALITLAACHSVFDSLDVVARGIGFLGVQSFEMGANLLMGILSFGIHVFQSICAAKMGHLESYKLAVIGAVLCMLPFLTPFVILGIPFAIWSLVLLRRPDIRSAFESKLNESM